MKFIGHKIRKIRELKGYTQDYMATKLEMSQRSYSKLEKEEIKLDWQRIEKISDILEIEPTDLITFDDNLIFHNSPQGGKNNTNTIHNYFPEELKKSYEDRIKHLEEEVIFLRSIVRYQ